MLFSGRKRDTYIKTSSGTVYTTSRDCVSTGDIVLSKREGKAALYNQGKDSLLDTLKEGDTVYGIVRSVARSGMSRRIDFYKLTNEGPLYLTGRFAQVLGTDDYDGGLRVNGCGMDMIFATVENVASHLKLKLRHASL